MPLEFVNISHRVIYSKESDEVDVQRDTKTRQLLSTVKRGRCYNID